MPDREGLVTVPARTLQAREFVHGDGLAWESVALAWRLPPRFEASRVREALIDVVRAHETLRSGFRRHEGDVVLVIAPRGDVRWSQVAIDRLPASRDAAAVGLGSVLAPFQSERWDLSMIGLIRAVFIEEGAWRRHLVLLLPHAIWDASSTSVFEDEMRTRLACRDAAAPPSIRFGDFAAWDTARDDPRAVAYWRGQLEDGPRRLRLPRIGRDRPPGYEPGEEIFSIAPSVANRLAEHARAQRTTFATALLAAFTVLLHGVTRASDLTVGFTRANRTDVALRRMLGMMLDSSLIRVRFSSADSYLDVLHRVHAAVIEALDHPLPVERQVSHPSPVHAVAPFADVVFNVIPAPAPPAHDAPHADLLRRESIEPSSMLWPTRAVPWGCQLDLTLKQHVDHSLEAIVGFNRRVFDDAQIDRLRRRLRTLLAVIGDDPTRQLVDVAAWHDW